MVSENPENVGVPARNATPFSPDDNISVRLDEMDGDIKDVLTAVNGIQGGGGAVDFGPVLTPLGNAQTAITSIQQQVAAQTAMLQALAAGLGIAITPSPVPSPTPPAPPAPAPANEDNVVQPNPAL